MSVTERYGKRDLSYSTWHRAASISRFVPMEIAAELDYIDLDAIEVCHRCREPLCLIELAQDVGQDFKATTIMEKLAARAGTRALLVFYKADASGDVVRFRVRPLWGTRQEKIMEPAQYARVLVWLREQHEPECERRKSQNAVNVQTG